MSFIDDAVKCINAARADEHRSRSELVDGKTAPLLEAQVFATLFLAIKTAEQTAALQALANSLASVIGIENGATVIQTNEV